MDIKAATVYLQTSVSCLHHMHDYSLYSMLPPSHKRSIIVQLCSNKIAWDNYASLQMISEYFSVRDRPLNYVKKPSSFVEFDKLAAILDFESC